MLACLVWLAACDDFEEKNNQTYNDAESMATAKGDGQKISWIYIPPGSEIEEGEDAGFVKPPEDWIYIGYTEDGDFIKNPGKTISISCRCATTGVKGGCAPWFAKGMGQTAFGCASTGCDHCILEINYSGNKIENGGFVQPGSGVILDPEPEAGAVFQAMFEMPELLDSLESFYSWVYGSGNSVPRVQFVNGEMIPPAGHFLFPGTIFGRSTVLVLPKNDPRFAAIAGGFHGISASCDCQGYGGCRLVSNGGLMGKLYWCVNTCTEACVLTIKMQNANGAIKLIELVNYNN